jgi:hypothetical protein
LNCHKTSHHRQIGRTKADADEPQLANHHQTVYADAMRYDSNNKYRDMEISQIWKPTETQQESPANLNRFDNGQRIKYPMKNPSHTASTKPQRRQFQPPLYQQLNITTPPSSKHPLKHHHHPKHPSSTQHHLTTTTSSPTTNGTCCQAPKHQPPDPTKATRQAYATSK